MRSRKANPRLRMLRCMWFWFWQAEDRQHKLKSTRPLFCVMQSYAFVDAPNQVAAQ